MYFEFNESRCRNDRQNKSNLVKRKFNSSPQNYLSETEFHYTKSTFVILTLISNNIQVLHYGH